MIPLPLAKFGMQYGTKILAGLLSIGIVWGGYTYWKNEQQEIGEDRKNAEWLEYQAKVNAKSEAIIELKQAEFERDLKKYKEERDNELNQYHQYSQNLERDLADSRNKRLLVRTKANNKVCPDTGKSGGQVPKGGGSGGQTSDWAELAEADSDAIQVTAIEAQKMANICAQALSFIERNNLAE